MIAAFEAENPNINVEVETAAWDDYFTLLQTKIAGGDAPDVFELNYENFVSFASKDTLQDLTPLAEADASYNADVFYPRSMEAFNYNGMQQALPETFSTVVLFYNKDLFDAAGVGYPEPDWTWDDAVAAAEQITDADAGVWGLFSPVQFWEFYKKAAQNQCEFFNEDMTEVLLNSPACVEAVETMVSFANELGVMPTAEEMAGVSDGDMFNNGQLGMLVSGIWMFGAFAEAPFGWDIQVEPGMVEQATHFFSNGLSVSATAENPEEAWAWAKFFSSSPEMAKMRVATGWELPTLTDQTLFEDYLALSPPDNRQAVFDSLKYSIVPPVIERQNELQDTIGLYLDKVVLGEMSAEEALEQASIEIAELLN
jgi:multiple sugar transport system substrate-binding protein